MVRKLLAIVAITMFGVTAAAAQSCQDTITARQTLMKKSGAAAKIGSAMIKGDTPYDQAKVQEVLAAFAEDAKQMPTLFPDCSKTGDDTTAGPAIWAKADDFKAMIAKFAADVKAAQDNVKDVDTLKASFQTVGQDCNSCHQTFRVRKG